MNEKKLELEGQDLVDVSLEELWAEFNIDDEWLEKTVTIPVQKAEEAAPAGAEPESAEEAPEEAAETSEEAPVEELAEAPAQAVSEPAEQEIPEEEPRSTVTDDTVRLDDVRQAIIHQMETMEDTIPLENISDAVAAEEEEVPDDTVRLDDLSHVESAAESLLGQRIAEEEEAPAPMEQLHRDPIVFDPRARMRELKRQIIAGPEKRYYELTEKGVLKYQLGMLMCLVVIGLSVAVSVCFDAGVISENRLRFTVFAQVLGLLVGGLLGSGLMIDGIADLFRGKFTLNTWLTVAFLACCADSVFCLMEQRVPVCAAFTLEVAMAHWAAYHRRVTEMGQMDTLRKATRLNGLVFEEDFLEDRPGVLKTMGSVDDFMDNYQAASGPERIQNLYAAISLILAVAVAALTAMLNGWSMAVQILSTTLLVAVPASFFIAVTRPGAVLERRLHAMGTVICGWKGVRELCRKCVYPLYDGDIFPSGAAKLNGVKFYGGRNPEQIIAFAAALMRVNGGGLEPIFEELLISRNGARYEVENVHFYGNGGIGGEICEEPVLMGSLEFLKDMGVEIPDGVMVKQAVYLSVDGDLCGLFAINYNRMKHATMGLVSLCTNRRVKTVMMAEDFMLTGSFMKDKFGVNTRRMLFPDREKRAELGARTPAEDAPAMALTTQAGLGPAAYAVSGAHALRKTCKMGVGVHVFGGLLGVLIMLALCIQGSAHLLSPVRILLYQLVWIIPGLVITEGARSV